MTSSSSSSSSSVFSSSSPNPSSMIAVGRDPEITLIWDGPGVMRNKPLEGPELEPACVLVLAADCEDD